MKSVQITKCFDFKQNFTKYLLSKWNLIVKISQEWVCNLEQTLSAPWTQARANLRAQTLNQMKSVQITKCFDLKQKFYKVLTQQVKLKSLNLPRASVQFRANLNCTLNSSESKSQSSNFKSNEKCTYYKMFWFETKFYKELTQQVKSESPKSEWAIRSKP